MFPSHEKRSDPRWDFYIGCTVSINSRMGKLLDVSALGARISTNRTFAEGSTVVVVLPWDRTVRGQVLECKDGVLRMKFDFEIDEPF